MDLQNDWDKVGRHGGDHLEKNVKTLSWVQDWAKYEKANLTSRLNDDAATLELILQSK